MGAEIRPARGKKLKVQILDLSQTGFRMECLTYLSDGNAIFLAIPNFYELESRVIWQTEWMYGCRFKRPLHAAIYDHIVRTFPALGVEQTKGLDGIIYGAAAARSWGAQRQLSKATGIPVERFKAITSGDAVSRAEVEALARAWSMSAGDLISSMGGRTEIVEQQFTVLPLGITRFTDQQRGAIERVCLFQEGVEPSDCDLRTVFDWTIEQ